MEFENMIKMQFMIDEIDIIPEHVHIFIKCNSINTNIAETVQHHPV